MPTYKLEDVTLEQGDVRIGDGILNKFVVKLEGHPQPVVVWRQTTAHPLFAGDTIEGEIQNARYGQKLKVTQYPVEGGQSLPPAEAPQTASQPTTQQAEQVVRAAQGAGPTAAEKDHSVRRAAAQQRAALFLIARAQLPELTREDFFKVVDEFEKDAA